MTYTGVKKNRILIKDPMTISQNNRMTICRRTEGKIFDPSFSSLLCCPYLIFLQSSLSLFCVLFSSFFISDCVWWDKHIITYAFLASCESQNTVQKKEISHHLDFFRDRHRISESAVFIVWYQWKISHRDHDIVSSNSWSAGVIIFSIRYRSWILQHVLDQRIR